ncbi:MAG: hypothetical protein JKY27_03590 [Magnetovibrio sp.]|nr:hypothetical protein [Magnetovibrio sp.]
MHWPHQDNGCVDWESVFDDEDTGLTVYAERAKTTQALARCAHMIVQSLFIRDDDPPHRDAYNNAIRELVASEDAHTRDKLLLMIQDIKLDRIKRSGHVLSQGDGDGERRHEQNDPTKSLKVLRKN